MEQESSSGRADRPERSGDNRSRRGGRGGRHGRYGGDRSQQPEQQQQGGPPRPNGPSEADRDRRPHEGDRRPREGAPDRRPRDQRGGRGGRPVQKPRLSVVIPVYNEINTIEEIVRRVRDVDWPKEIIIVDDCSTDGTREVLQRLHGYGNVRVYCHETNQGKGAALHTGFSHVSGDIVIVQDADLEYYPDEYPQLIDLIVQGKADVVYGSRFLGRHRAFLFSHYLGNLLLTFIANVLYNTTLTDMETCYKAFRSEVLRGLNLRSRSFGFEPEFTAKVFRRGYRVYETPISYAGRSYAEGKKITWKAGLTAIYWLLRGKFERLNINQETRARMAIIPRYNRWVLSAVEPHLGKRVLELSAAAGDMTHHLLGRELVVATDPDYENLHTLRTRFVQGPRTRIMRFDPALPTPDVLRGMRFDTILCYNTLEKIEDDGGALHRLQDLLEPGGRLLLVVPAHNGLYCPMDKALGRARRYSWAELAGKLAASGLEVESCRYFNVAGALGWLVNGKLLRRKILPKQQLRLFNLLTGLFRLEGVISLPFGLSLVAVARKKARTAEPAPPEARKQPAPTEQPREAQQERRDGDWRRGPRRAAPAPQRPAETRRESPPPEPPREPRREPPPPEPPREPRRETPPAEPPRETRRESPPPEEPRELREKPPAREPEEPKEDSRTYDPDEDIIGWRNRDEEDDETDESGEKE